MKIREFTSADTRLFGIENPHLSVEVAPALGGRITRIYHKGLDREFLWHNREMNLAAQPAGADYDACFWGGIDELLPNDIPETVDGIPYPDHGELWTTPLGAEASGTGLALDGLLKKSGIRYRKVLALQPDKPVLEIRYTLRNESPVRRHFLWKLHAALRVQPGDRLVTDARRAAAVYPDSTRFPGLGEFSWPDAGGTDAAIVPAKNGTMDFFYLYEVQTPVMALHSRDAWFEYRYDPAVFPYQWYFASYGQFNGHYTVILEPASAMPVSVAQARALGQCSVLEPGAEIRTTVTIYAGPPERR